jgi:hypothetical protein
VTVPARKPRRLSVGMSDSVFSLWAAKLRSPGDGGEVTAAGRVNARPQNVLRPCKLEF